jgi:Rrf2 family protein
MNQLSQTTVYALRAVYDISELGERDPVSIADTARRQQIPRRFLEEILRRLRQAGIVRSTRGKHGGYQLESSARELTLGDVVRVFESATERREGGGVLCDVLQEATEAYAAVLDRYTFEDLLRRKEHLRFVPNYCI